VSEGLPVQVIGLARTPWRRREDAPHQPGRFPAAPGSPRSQQTPVAAPDREGTIEIAAEFRKGLADLESFDRIWLIFLFDRSKGFALTVKPPRGGPKRGLFATRAPDRPSQIGLTSVALKAVDLATGVLSVEGIDLLDGTPILDIKPYLRNVDCWPEAGLGWLTPYLAAGIEPKLKKPYRPE
jgi:tRNA-Thr(GGU) m(6)t(6)A37 methyltransferase TsaA